MGDSRKLRRLYIFWVIFVLVNFFYRAWNVSIGMNALRSFYMKRETKGNRTYAS